MVDNRTNDFEIFVNDILDNTGKIALKYFRDLKDLSLKRDMSPVTKADKEIEKYIRTQILNHYPNHNIVGEEYKEVTGTENITWYIDPIDGTKEYIAGKDEYTLNAALVINTVPVLGLVGVPKKKRLFFSYSPGQSYLIEENITKKISCKKQQPKGKIVALSSVIKPSDIILNKLKQFNVTSIVKMASSYKFCVIATGEFDIYAARERANEWDYAAGHAIAQNAGAIIKTLDEKPFLYGKEDYRNPSLLIKRSENLND